MSVLVTGGAGFLGAHLVRALMAQGRTPIVLDDLSGGARENVPEGIELVAGSICDEALVARLFRERRFEVVFHLAAYAAEGLSHHIRRFNYTNNVVGSATLINEAIRHDVRRFVFTSSIAVYGEGRVPLREDDAARPIDPYGIAKLAVEQDLAAARARFGLEHTIFRPHNLYGPYQSLRDRYRNVVGIFLNHAMQGRDLPIFGDGAQRRAFTFASDVMPAIAASAWSDRARDAIVNVGGDQPHTVRELADAVLRVTGAAVSIRHEPARHEAVHAFCDHARAREVLGPHPETPLEKGLRATWEWARTAGPRETPAFAEIELERGLPEIWRAP